MREKLYDLQIRQQELAARFTESHPSFGAIKSQVREVQSILALQAESRGESVVGPNPEYQSLHQALLNEEAQLQSYEAEQETLLAQRSAMVSELKSLNAVAVRIGDLERQAALAEERYRANTEKLEQARIHHALDQQRVSSVNIVQPATFVEKPVSPNKRLCLAAGLLLALVGGSCLALVVEYFSPPFGRAAPAELSPATPALVSISSLPEGV
jgi:uncharacterized protein involved in exopolysaccharide biosynthesis